MHPEPPRTGNLPVAPALAPTLARAHVGAQRTLVDARVVFVCALSIALALLAGVAASVLTKLIGLCTNLAFYGRISTELVSPAEHHLGAWSILVPVAGGLIVGVMARYGSKAIRGHGIPEAMEQVLTRESRIPARMTFLKPVSAAISIGTGGPFGAEGPIIATGGALGSLLGQLLHTSASERKTLLAAGAAAGMSATFASPVSAVLLAIELLLFEYRPRSVIPVALAAAVAAGVHAVLVGSDPVFPMAALAQPSAPALASYVVLGALVGLASVGVTRAVYAIEDAFEKLPIHWMWWPALGGLAVGLVGRIAPRTMGVGYDNIEHILGGQLAPTAVATLCAWKFVSWSVSLGSGTSGGTLAPLFTLGGGLGATLGVLATQLAPGLGVDLRIAALVGMAAMFAGASRALLASVVFAFETTRQPLGLLPLLSGCSAAYLVSCLLMQNSIMTEKIERRGVRVLGEYAVDFLAQLTLGERARRSVVTVPAEQTLGVLRDWIEAGGLGSHHQGFPVVDGEGGLLGIVTRKDIYAPHAADLRVAQLVQRPCLSLTEERTFRDAADLMAREKIGRIPVISRADPRRIVGLVTRSDLVEAHVGRLAAHERVAPLPLRPRRR